MKPAMNGRTVLVSAFLLFGAGPARSLAAQVTDTATTPVQPAPVTAPAAATVPKQPAQSEAEVSKAEKDTAAAIASRVLATRDSLAKANKTLQFGLSIGTRVITDLKDVNIRNAVISPIDQTLQVDKRDPVDVVLSGVISVYPWKKKADTTRVPRDAGRTDTTITYHCRGMCKIGFVANVNLASFNSDNLSAFNRSIEGGIGVALRLTDDFALALTFERVFSRRIRDFLEPGETIVVDGETLDAIDEKDNRFFVDDNLNALSFKFVYII